MADGLTTMFGKAYDTVGSADKNLILQTRGDLKVKWGGKYIDLIKNGKINVDVDLLKKVDSKEDIYKDGLYLIDGEETQEVWLSIGGTLVNLLGEIGTTYVSYVAPQDVDAEGKFRALSNIGFFYESIETAQTAKIQQGLIYILAENQLYYVIEGKLVKYEPQLNIPNPLVIGTLTIDGNTANIYGSKDLSLSIGSDNYIKLGDTTVQVNQELVTYKDLQSWDFVGSQKGYILTTTENDESLLEVDIVRVRKYIDYSNKVKVTYNQLLDLISQKKLIEGKEYVIIDFQNEWEVTEPELTYLEDNDINVPNVHPITVTAVGYNSISRTAYVEGHPEWVIQYDINYKHFIKTYTQTDELGNTKSYDLYTKGKITKMSDELGNVANYDFKHRLFKYTSTSDEDTDWYFTFNITNDSYKANSLDWAEHHTNADASQVMNTNVKNNKIYIKEPTLERRFPDDPDNEEMKITIPEDYILFPNCSTHIPYGNSILESEGKFVITNEFYNNTFKKLVSETDVAFNLDFHDNTFQRVENCVLNAPMQFNIFDNDLLNVNFKCDQMMNNHITGTITTNNNGTSFPIEATNFNDNVINNITTSSISCYGCNIIKNIIHNIINCFISNTNLENNEIQDITGDSSEIPDVPGGDPVNPGGDDPVNPPSGSGITLLSSEPTATSVNSSMTGTHNYAAGGLDATASSSETIGTIAAVSDSYGQPTVYGVYVDENGNMIDLSSTSNVTFSGTNSTGYTVSAKILANNTTSQRKVHLWIQFADANELGYFSIYQAAGSGSVTPGGDTPSGGDTTGDTDVDEYLNTFKASSLSSTPLSSEKYSLLSTAMDKLDSFESNIMSDSMFVDDVLTLPSGNSTDTRNARRGWFMGLLLTALYPMTGPTTVNNAILTDAMSNWGISQSTNTNTYSVSTYEAKYKGLLQGSIAFSWLFGDSSFVNSFAPFASYTYQGSDGDLGASSSMGYYHAPKGQYFFPYPPTNNINATSGLMNRDEDAFILGQSLRSTSRGTTAREDIETGLSYYLSILQAATGKNNSSGDAYTLMYDTHWNGNRTVNNIKNTDSFWRSRPAWENNDTSVDSDTYNLNFGTASGKSGSTSYSTSYPSGHTGYFWNTAYCFAAIGGLSNSAVVNLFKRAYQYSESRVIAGAHWQMCVEMGRIAAACSFATLCGNTKFIEELQEAQS